MTPMVALDNAAHVLGSYAVTFGAIALFAWRMLSSARRAARHVPPEDRPWT